MDNISSFLIDDVGEVLLRLPNDNDTQKMFEYVNELSREDSFLTNIDGKDFSYEEEEKFLQEKIGEIENHDAVQIICELHREIVGIATVTRKQKPPHIRQTHVGMFGITLAKEMRGKGLGKFLMSEIMHLAQQHITGMKMIELHCFSTNIGALKLYEKLGFRECGRVPKALLHHGEYVDEVIMYFHTEAAFV